MFKCYFCGHIMHDSGLIRGGLGGVIQCEKCWREERFRAADIRPTAPIARPFGERCEGCHTSGHVEIIKINVTNGVLALCRQCLDDVNRKNPELATLRSALSAYVTAQSRMLDKWAESDREGKHKLWLALHACEDAARVAIEKAGAK